MLNLSIWRFGEAYDRTYLPPPLLHYLAYYAVLGWEIQRTIMASSEEDAAAEQLGSMSLGESAERAKDNETEHDEAPAKFCSACETKSDTLMKCRACKCVWYCDKDCQNKHWKEHKKECKLIKKELDKRGGKLDVGTELDIGPVGKLPPREECPICMRALPIHESLLVYFPCCGKTICGGCDHQHQLKNSDQAGPHTCAFCRTAMPGSDKETLARAIKRVELKDPEALHSMAMGYGEGECGLPVDQAKSIDLMRQSADLNNAVSQYQLGNYYDDGEMGLERNEAEALKYWKKAAGGGHCFAQHNLGNAEYQNGEYSAAMRHWRLSASGGFKNSLNNVIFSFEEGLLHHGGLAETLQAFYCSRAEMKSVDRDRYIEHLKETGEYREENHDY